MIHNFMNFQIVTLGYSLKQHKFHNLFKNSTYKIFSKKILFDLTQYNFYSIFIFLEWKNVYAGIGVILQI